MTSCPESSCSNQYSPQDDTSCDAQTCSGDEEMTLPKPVDTNNAQGNVESLEELRDVKNHSVESPKFYFGTLQNISDFISESQDSLSCANELFSTSSHPKLSLQNEDPPQEDAFCSCRVDLGSYEKLLSQNSVETNKVEGNLESLEGQRDARKKSSEPPKCCFGVPENISDCILGSPVSASPAEDIISPSVHRESSLSCLDSPQEDTSCNVEETQSAGEAEELPLRSELQMNNAQSNTESLRGLKDSKNNSLGLPQFRNNVVQNMSASIREVQDSSPAIDVSSMSRHSKSSLSCLESLQDDTSCSAEGCLDDCEELRFQSSAGTNLTQHNIEKLAELSNKVENSVPLNLFQDSWSSKLSTLPDRCRTALENLISQIGYQINYFSLKFKKISQSSGMTLICKMCGSYHSIEGAKKHVSSKIHLSKLSHRCEKTSQTLAAAIIKAENWEFVDFNESSQCYQCNLCDVKLSDVISSWYEHVQIDLHLSKLKALRGKAPMYTVSAYGSASSSKSNNNGANGLKNIITNVNDTRPCYVPPSTVQTKLHKNSFRVLTEILSKRDKRILKHVQDRLQDNINYFKPTYEDEQGRLFLICKLCKKSIILENVTSHVSSNAHLKNLKKHSSKFNSEAGQNSVNDVKSIGGFLSDANEKIVEDLACTLKDFTAYFEPFENVSDQLYFICKACTMLLLLKELRSHLKSCPVLESSPETKLNEKSCATVESLNIEDEKVIMKLTEKLRDT